MAQMSEDISDLQTRGFLALAVRTAQRIIPTAGDQEFAQIYWSGIKIPYAFVEGRPENPIAIRSALNRLGGIAQNPPPPMFEIISPLAHAGECAYQAACQGPTAYRTAFNLSRDFLNRAGATVVPSTNTRNAEAIFAPSIEKPFFRDLAAISHSHSGNFEQPGDPIDLGARGPLGLLWAEGEEPGWSRAARQLPQLNMLPATEAMSVAVLSREKPDFVCFYVANDHDEYALQAAKETLEAAAREQHQLKPRPGFYIYAPELEQTKRFELIALGGVVVAAEELGGRVPGNVGEFAKLLSLCLDDTLRGWHSRIGAVMPPGSAATAFKQEPPTSDSQTEGRDKVGQGPVTVDSDYDALLGWLTTAPDRFVEY
jgi:hypothetical protein